MRNGSVSRPRAASASSGDPAARPLGAEEDELVERLLGTGLQEREDGADRLADAGGRLRGQAAPEAGGAEHRFGQHALAGAERGMREGQRLQRAVALGAMRQLAVGPVEEARARVLELALQVARRAVRLHAGFALRADVEVHQRDRERVDPFLRAQQRAVDPGLRPVQRAVIGGHAVEVALVRLDLLQATALGVVAVGTAAHGEVPVRAGQRHLGAIRRAARAGDGAVPDDAFGRAGRRREPQVEITLPRRENRTGHGRRPCSGGIHRCRR
jgi:hypothetical protein